MRFIIDSMLPRDLAELLISLGYEAVTVQRLKLGSNTDTAIWDHADQTRSVIISKDADYLAFSKKFSRAKLVHLRMPNASTETLVRVFEQQHAQIVSALANGELIVEVS